MGDKHRTRGERIIEAYYDAWSDSIKASNSEVKPVTITRTVGSNEKIRVTHLGALKAPSAEIVKQEVS